MKMLYNMIICLFLCAIVTLSWIHHLSEDAACPNLPGTSTSVERLHVIHHAYGQHLYNQFEKLASDKTLADNPKLVALAQQLLDPPAIRRFKSVGGPLPPWTPQESIAFQLLGNKTGGFFVEVGGFDGISASNSLHLEQEHGWEGLLIEADPDFYLQIRGHNRRAWSINAGIGLSHYAEVIPFWDAIGQSGKLNTRYVWTVRKKKNIKTIADRNRVDKSKLTKTMGMLIPCFPLETLLLALKQKTVDFFSLDVEGVELEVLKTIPFDKIDIKVLAVEYMHGGPDAKERYTAFMEDYGYKLYMVLTHAKPHMFAHDLIFVKQ